VPPSAPDTAVAQWIAACRASWPIGSEVVALDDALGRVAADPVHARRSSPGFPAAAMDGIAVRAADVVGPGPPTVRDGEFAVVDTGDPVPPPFDAVVRREDLERDGATVRLAKRPEPGAHVRPIGEDVAAGELAVAPGRTLGPFDLALLAAGGHTELAVRRRPAVALIPTGDEIRPSGATLAAGEIADTNSTMLEAQAREAGGRPTRWPILGDDPDLLARAVRRAAAGGDMVLLLAGTSAGRHDHAGLVLERCGRVVAHGVAMRPGHPAVLAVVDGTPVLGCPGYPVSAALAFDLLARPLLDRMLGRPRGGRPAVDARLGAALASRPGAAEHVRVALGTVAGAPVAVGLRRGASVLSSLARADAIVTVPAAEGHVAAGTEVRAGTLRDALAADRLLVAGRPDRGLDLVLTACARAHLAADLCEMDVDEALEILRAGGCHAVWTERDAESAAPDDVTQIDLAERDTCVAVAPGDPRGILRPGARPRDIRAVAGPARLANRPAGAVTVRSDDAAADAVARGHADCAFVGAAAARAAGLDTRPTGRSWLGIAVRPGAVRGDPVVAALIEVLARADLARALAADGLRPLAGVARAA
jgi:putative molybdopterin biosynthesis protein